MSHLIFSTHSFVNAFFGDILYLSNHFKFAQQKIHLLLGFIFQNLRCHNYTHYYITKETQVYYKEVGLVFLTIKFLQFLFGHK